MFPLRFNISIVGFFASPVQASISGSLGPYKSWDGLLHEPSRKGHDIRPKPQSFRYPRLTELLTCRFQSLESHEMLLVLISYVCPLPWLARKDNSGILFLCWLWFHPLHSRSLRKVRLAQPLEFRPESRSSIQRLLFTMESCPLGCQSRIVRPSGHHRIFQCTLNSPSSRFSSPLGLNSPRRRRPA